MQEKNLKSEYVFQEFLLYFESSGNDFLTFEGRIIVMQRLAEIRKPEKVTNKVQAKRDSLSGKSRNLQSPGDNDFNALNFDALPQTPGQELTHFGTWMG